MTAAAALDPETLSRRLRAEASQLASRARGLRATERMDAQMAAYGMEAAAERLRQAAGEIEQAAERLDRGESDDR